MNISFIGGGVMAEAIVAGILAKEIARPEEICVGEPVEARRHGLEMGYGVATTADNQEALEHGALVILSIKPQSLPPVLKGLKGRVKDTQAVVSIIAGTRMESLVTGLGHDAVVRVMPNTPAQIGSGMSVWTASSSVNGMFRKATRSILQTLGEEMYVEEEKYIDMATALSGSGPAYIFLFIESMVDAGVYLGMSREMARKLSQQTVLGSARLAQQSAKHLAELRDMVTSPGGTTAEALRVLEEGGFRTVILEAVSAAYEKSRLLGEK